MTRPLWIMIAGPYTTNADTAAKRKQNMDILNKVAVEVFKKGHVPILGVNMALPMVEATSLELFDQLMMPMSYALAKKCDAVLRIGGISVGADLEVEAIKAQGGKVFYNVEEIPTINGDTIKTI